MSTDIITITIPAIDPQIIANLEQIQLEAPAAEVQAIATLREKYSPLAKHGQYVKIGWYTRGDGSDWGEERYFYHDDETGKHIRALLVVDDFDRQHNDQNSGQLIGERLYLLPNSGWLVTERKGYWSRWRGATEYWACRDCLGDFVAPRCEEDEYAYGHVTVLSDAQIADRYPLSRILEGLAKALGLMQSKLPERYAKLKARTELAKRLCEELGNAS